MSPSPAWHTLTAAQALLAAGSPEGGLDTATAARRLAEDGPNALPEPRRPGPLALFLAQFKSLVIVVLLVAAGVSAFLGERVDAAAILLIVVLNAGIGFYQEYNAERSIAALRKLTAPMAKVRRSGQVQVVAALEVVRGDWIEFESGDILPADARLLDASDLRCVEAALTGEAEAVGKSPEALSEADLPLGDRRNLVFMGTSVATGAGRAVVVATGLRSEMGKIAGLIESAAADDATPLQKRLDALGRTLVWACLALVTLLFALGYVRGMEPFQLFLTSVSLAVAAAPEGLPAVVTIALALGVRRMARRHALVRRLPSVETLGSASVICTDKTGTLTLGEMTVQEMRTAGSAYQLTGVGLDPEGSIACTDPSGTRPPDEAQKYILSHYSEILTSTLTAEVYPETQGATRVWKVAGDPTEGAFLVAARKIETLCKSGTASGSMAVSESGAGPEPRFSARRTVVHRYPFDSDRKRASAVIEMDPANAALRREVHVNGAPDLLLGLCTHHLTADGVQPLDAAAREAWLAENAEMAGRGLRVIGSAFRPWAGPVAVPPALKPPLDAIESDLVFMGLAGLLDPPRPEAAEAVRTCQAAGIRVVMITGDHPATAAAIGRKLGIVREGDGVLTGRELETLSPGGLDARVAATTAYARVSAEHKLRIIEAWKRQGAVVAMTGDGVNDAPALKGAHIGIAMGKSGTEVTKQASDMVIADDHFATIAAAVEEGRGIYRNIRNTLQFLLAGNAGELLLMVAAMLAGLPAPLLPIHLLWINLVTDGLPALCLAAERIDGGVMRNPPRTQGQFLSDRHFLITLLITGLLTAAVAFGVFIWALGRYGIEEARSLAFAALVCSELLRSLGARSEYKPIWRMRARGNWPLLAVVAGSLVLQIVGHQTAGFEAFLKTSPFSVREWATLLALAALPLAVLEVLKVTWRPQR